MPDLLLAALMVALGYVLGYHVAHTRRYTNEE